MSFHINKKDNCAVVSVDAEKFDSKIAPSLKAQFVLLKNEGFRNVVIDLSKCRYCDSSGLSAILIANRLCQEANGICVICHVNKGVANLIEISQLDTILNIVTTLDEAMQYITMEEIEKGVKKEKKK